MEESFFESKHLQQCTEVYTPKSYGTQFTIFIKKVHYKVLNFYIRTKHRTFKYGQRKQKYFANSSVPQSCKLMSQQAISACKGISSGRVSFLANVDPTVPFTPSFGLSTPASSHFANSKRTQESQSELEHQLQALLSPSRDVLSSIEPDCHSSVLSVLKCAQ